MVSSYSLLRSVYSFAIISYVYGKCTFNGQTFEPYRVVYKLYEEANDWCSVGLCKDNGEIWRLIDLSCRQKPIVGKTMSSPTSIPVQTTEQVVRCIYNGTEYWPGSEVFRGMDEKKGSCYVLICSMKGEIVMRDRKRCKTKYHSVAVSTPTIVEDHKEQDTQEPYQRIVTNPFGCHVDGKFFSPGMEISEGYDKESDWCYGQYCNQNGEVISWDTWNCKGKSSSTEAAPQQFPTTLPPFTNTSETVKVTTPPSKLSHCYHNKRIYNPKDEISKDFDKKTGLCHFMYCGERGELIRLDGRPCKENIFATDNNLPTTLPHKGRSGCFYNDKHYNPGEDISRGYDEIAKNCYGTYCNQTGSVISWTDINCERDRITSVELPTTSNSGPSSIPTTQSTGQAIGENRKAAKETIESTSSLFTEEPHKPSMYTTVPPGKLGCYDDGAFYRPGDTISEGYDPTSDWCYGQYCNEIGEIIRYDTWNCKRKSKSSLTTAPPPPTTFPPVDSTPPPPIEPREKGLILDTIVPPHKPGCYDNGVFYRPGETISEGYDPTSDWCYGQYCDESGGIISWDTWNCRKKTLPPTTAPPPTTYTLTEVPSTESGPIETALKCNYNFVQYSRGETVYKKYDKRNNWCYGLFCSDEGELVYWDKWNCKELSTPSSPLLQKIHKTDSSATVHPKGDDTVRCIYKGVEYFSRQIITKDCNNKDSCKVLFCNYKGIVVPKLLRDISRKEM